MLGWRLTRDPKSQLLFRLCEDQCWVICAPLLLPLLLLLTQPSWLEHPRHLS